MRSSNFDVQMDFKTAKIGMVYLISKLIFYNRLKLIYAILLTAIGINFFSSTPTPSLSSGPVFTDPAFVPTVEPFRAEAPSHGSL